MDKLERCCLDFLHLRPDRHFVKKNFVKKAPTYLKILCLLKNDILFRTPFYLGTYSINVHFHDEFLAFTFLVTFSFPKGQNF